MKRREFVAGLTATTALPRIVQAQQPLRPVVGILHSLNPEQPFLSIMAALREALVGQGFVEGSTVSFQYRWARGEYDKLPSLAAELVRQPVTVLVTIGGEPAAMAARSATATIPIVAAFGGDPTKLGLVASLNQPGGNITGISSLSAALEAKRLDALREAVGKANTVGVLLNPNFPPATDQLREINAGAVVLNLRIKALHATTDREIEAAIGSVRQDGIDALIVTGDPFFISRSDNIVRLANHHRVPAIYPFRQFATAGGLLCYAINLFDLYGHLGRYAGLILKGSKPAELPVVQPTKFELVLNLKAASALGITFPESLLARADEVIE